MKPVRNLGIFSSRFCAIFKTLFKFCLPGDYKNNPQTLLFSATLPQWTRKTARRYLKPDCQLIDLIGSDTVQASVTVEVMASMSEMF